MKTDLIRYNREYLISVRAEAIRSTFDLNSVGHLISRRGTKVYIYIYIHEGSSPTTLCQDDPFKEV